LINSTQQAATNKKSEIRKVMGERYKKIRILLSKEGSVERKVKIQTNNF
jgi:hypothetical protein